MENSDGQIIEERAAGSVHREAKLERMPEKGPRCSSQHFHVVPDLAAKQLHHMRVKGLKGKTSALWRTKDSRPLSSPSPMPPSKDNVQRINRNHILIVP